MKRHSLPTILLAFLAGIMPLFGLAEEKFGPDSTRPHPTVAQADWPAGLVDLARHESRVYSIWVNGHEDFHFQADQESLQQLIDLFSRMRVRDHDIRIITGTPHAKPINGAPVHYNVKLTFLGGIALGMSRESMEPTTHEPAITIHLDPDTALDTLRKLTIPDNIILRNEVEGSTLKASATKPTRKVWHSRIDFGDGTPATDFENGVSTHITLWEKNNPVPIALGGVSHEGKFHTALSGDEISALKCGASWLTMTTGNWSTKPKSTHPKISIDSFSLDPKATRPVTVSKPGFYHGRVLFDDGTPPVLDPPPWPGAQIRVEFPYTHPSDLDAEGYFRAYFSDTQIKELQQREPRKNIYVPLYDKKGHSRALHAFPASKLAKTKAKAGVVKIPKPTPPEPE